MISRWLPHAVELSRLTALSTGSIWFAPEYSNIPYRWLPEKETSCEILVKSEILKNEHSMSTQSKKAILILLSRYHIRNISIKDLTANGHCSVFNSKVERKLSNPPKSAKEIDENRQKEAYDRINRRLERINLQNKKYQYLLDTK